MIYGYGSKTELFKAYRASREPNFIKFLQGLE